MPCCGRTADDGEDSNAGADSQAEIVFATVNTQPPRTIRGAAAAAVAAGASAPPADQQRLQKEIIDKSFGGRRHDPVNAASAAAAKTPTAIDSSSTPVEPNAATLGRQKDEDQVALETALPKLFEGGTSSGDPVEAVQLFLEGRRARYDDTLYMQQVAAAVDWLILAAPVAPLDHAIVDVVHQLLAVRMFTCALSSNDQWGRLQSAMRAASDAVCTARLQPLFTESKLAEGMGTAQVGQFWHHNEHYNPASKKPSQAALAPELYQLMQGLNFDDPADMAEYVCLHAARAINLMVNARFQAKVAAVAKRVAGCRHFDAAAKGFARSLVKILNDYARLRPGPGASWVCDGLRCLLTVPSVAAMHALISILNDEFAGFLQFKNPFALDEAGRADRAHLLLCNITAVFVPENGTFREMLAWPTSGPALEAMMAETASGQPAERWKRHVAAALELLRDQALAGVQVQVAVEIQLTFDSFRVVRDAVHLNYDMVRPSKCGDLWANFGGLEGEEEAHTMLRACIFGQLSLVERFLTAPVEKTADGVLVGCAGDVNARVGFASGGGQTALYVAAEANHCDVVGYLLKQPGIEVDKARTDIGTTPLCIAAQYGFGNVVKQLIAAKADVNKAMTTDGSPPLYIAAQNGFGDVVKQLIEAKADVNKAMTTSGATPLFIAAQFGHGDVVNQLIAAKADANKAMTTDGATPLFIAAVMGQASVIRQLLDANADVHQTTTAETGSYTALKMAKEQSQTEVVAMLIAAGAN